MFHMLRVVLVLAGAAAGGPVWAQAPAAGQAAGQAAERPAPNDYADPETWLCRPGRTDACAVDLTTTVVAADGRLTREPFAPHPNPPIDCFYVYPTVSTDRGVHSDMTADPAELNVVRQQFARFASVCRLYAPLYRQVTLAGLRTRMASGQIVALEDGLGYDDVRDAWRHYLQHDNQGRGVVLVGHSQGSFVLTRLLALEIEGTPVQSRLVSALLLGATIPVARGSDTGGAFTSIPVCRAATETGCVIAYSAYRSTLPPPANTLFGRVPDPKLEAICVDPAELAGSPNRQLHAYLSTGASITGGTAAQAWVAPGPPIDTPYVSVPGLLTAHCASNEHARYLEVTVHGNPSDPRTDDISGDLGNPPNAAWGLHLIDVNLAMGNLVEVVRRQAGAFAR